MHQGGVLTRVQLAARIKNQGLLTKLPADRFTGGIVETFFGAEKLMKENKKGSGRALLILESRRQMLQCSLQDQTLLNRISFVVQCTFLLAVGDSVNALTFYLRANMIW